ncbi:MAG: hypothetical protein D6710_03180 [Nitrospirae bacterium]|nr:MAG: hypothetical protein D6710_03180 [Nitrospirota bacterium]
MEASVAEFAKKEAAERLKTTLLVNDIVIPLNNFTQQYIGNILVGIAQSLGYSGKRINLYIEPSDLTLYTDDIQVPIRKEFVRLLIESTIKGVLSPLKGIFWFQRITISTEKE